MILNYAFLQIVCESVRIRRTFVGSIMTSKSKTTTMNTIHTLTKYYSSGKVETLTTGSLQDCQSELNQYKYLARKNGADIESEDETSMVCIDYAGNGVDVTFDIIDTQEELF